MDSRVEEEAGGEKITSYKKAVRALERLNGNGGKGWKSCEHVASVSVQQICNLDDGLRHFMTGESEENFCLVVKLKKPLPQSGKTLPELLGDVPFIVQNTQ